MRKILILIGLLLTFNLSGQILPGVVAGQGGGLSLCDEYQTVYDAYGIKPRSDTAIFQNTMVNSIVTNGLWPKAYLIYVPANGRAANALINWKSPGTYDLTDPGTTQPPHVAYEGFDGDGSSDYLLTGFIPATHLPANALDSITICIYELEGYNTTVTPFGVETGNNYLKIQARTGGNQRVWLNINNGLYTAVAGSQGFLVGTRRADNDVEAYVNGASIGTGTTSSLALPATNAMTVLANNDDGTIEEFSTYKTAVIMLFKGLTDAEVATLNTIVETYMDAIGKGVQ